MRILHTSDWHLGQHFMGYSREREHRALIHWVAQQLIEHDIDALLIVGDLFDTSTPPSYARECYNDLIVAVHEAGAQLVILGGNHDSAAVLNEHRSIARHVSTHIVTSIDRDHLAQNILALPDRNGQIGAILCAIPFIRPKDVLLSQSSQSASKTGYSDLQCAIAAHYDAMYQLAEQHRTNLGRPELPIIATGHLTALGTKLGRSESVRDIYIGTLEAFSTQDLPPVDYIALGHIHRAQTVGPTQHIRYCGSPLALSFDETEPKQMWQINLTTAGQPPQITSRPVPCFQVLRSLRGNFAAIRQQIDALELPPEDQSLWLEVLLDSDEYLHDAQTQIQALLQDRPMQLLRLRRMKTHQPASLAREQHETLKELSLEEVFKKRLALETLTPETEAALIRCYQEILEATHAAGTTP